MEIEADMSAGDPVALRRLETIGTPSTFVCPQCQGALWEVHDDQLMRFRCRVGHSYAADSMLAEKAEAVDTALWIALRSLEEKAALQRRLSRWAMDRQQTSFAQELEREAGIIDERAAVLRRLIHLDRKVMVDAKRPAPRTTKAQNGHAEARRTVARHGKRPERAARR